MQNTRYTRSRITVEINIYEIRQKLCVIMQKVVTLVWFYDQILWLDEAPFIALHYFNTDVFTLHIIHKFKS